MTSMVVLLALCLMLMLPSAALANDKSTADELLEFAKGQWDSFLGMVLAAVLAGVSLYREHDAAARREEERKRLANFAQGPNFERL